MIIWMIVLQVKTFFILLYANKPARIGGCAYCVKLPC